MQRRRLGGLEVSAVGLGCATMTPFYDEPDRDAAIETLRRAREIGVDFLDSSDAYGRGRNEELIARGVEGHRDEYVIASKFGNLRNPDGSPTSDGRPEYVKACCERSLKRLETDVIDLYYIHRVDPTVPIVDTVGAMSDLVRHGKVRHLGICEAGAATIRRAHATHLLTPSSAESKTNPCPNARKTMEPSASLRTNGIGAISCASACSRSATPIWRGSRAMGASLV